MSIEHELGGVSPDALDAWVSEFMAGKERALAKLITLVESFPRAANEIFARIDAGTDAGAAAGRVIGFTGPPGAGKSTLVDSVTSVLRKQNRRVGIVAVDPTSPFSGGALLGDRVRMERHYLDPGVFIRSLATRRGMGGLSPATKSVVRLMRLFGFDDILLETVGVGQIELDIMTAADSVVVVMVPESGDSIQTMKAGLMEIGDIFVVNKADRAGSDTLAASLKNAIGLSFNRGTWARPVIATSADRDEGTEELVQSVTAHVEHLTTSGEFHERRALREERELLELIGTHVAEQWTRVRARPDVAGMAALVLSRRVEVDAFLRKIIDAS